MKLLNKLVARSAPITFSLDSHYWSPSQTTYDGPAPDETDLEECTPANSELLDWAAQSANRPPQAWFDDGDDPFNDES